MKKLTRLVCVLVLAVGCSKGDSKPESAAKAETPAPAPKPVEPAPAAPVADKPVADKPVADPAPAKAGEEADRQMVAAIEDRAKVEFMPEQDPKWIPAEVTTRVQRGKVVVDVLADGKVIDTIDSGVDKGDLHMEARAKIGATKDGVVAVVSANKVTGKPADSYMARVYTWNASAKKFELGRKIEFEDAYDPAVDGE